MGDFSTCLKKAKAAMETTSRLIVDFEKKGDVKAYPKVKSQLQDVFVQIDSLTRAIYSDKPY